MLWSFYAIMFEISIPFAVELYVLHNKGMLNNVMKKIYLRFQGVRSLVGPGRSCNKRPAPQKCFFFFANFAR